MREQQAKLIKLAAELVQGANLPSSLIDDYPQRTYSAGRVAQMMEAPRERLRLIGIALRAIADSLPTWRSMETAPRDRRILVKSQSGELYVAHWVQHPGTGDEAYCISEGPDGMQHLIHPIEWREIFA
jgi:hypothetical protein